MERCDVEIVWTRGGETPEKFGVGNSSCLFDKGQGFYWISSESGWGHQFPRYSEFAALNNIVHFTTVTHQILTSDSDLQLCFWSNVPPFKWRLRASVDLCQLRMQHGFHLLKYLLWRQDEEVKESIFGLWEGLALCTFVSQGSF